MKGRDKKGQNLILKTCSEKGDSINRSREGK